MAIDVLAVFILRLIAEVVLLLAGYYTACVLIPTVTFGRIAVGTNRKTDPSFQTGERFVRTADGRFLLDGELAAYFGLLFWALVGAGVFMYHAAR